jgi:hypothetical protein
MTGKDKITQQMYIQDDKQMAHSETIKSSSYNSQVFSFCRGLTWDALFLKRVFFMENKYYL